MIALLFAAELLAQPLGSAEAKCRADESGPALEVSVAGFKDRRGLIRVELYPANDADFLADDTALIAAGKPFRRLDTVTPAAGAADICIRAPEAGVYSVVVMHDRNGNGKFNPFVDGAGFPGNPKLHLAKPKAAEVTAEAGPGVSHVSVVLNYWNGLSFAPLGRR